MKKIINRETMSYIVFGVLTTVVYFITRFSVVAMTENSLVAVIFAQSSAIIFAFLTNKAFVFKDHDWALIKIVKQLLGFILGRLFVFILDLVITLVAVTRYPDFFIHLFWLDKIDYQHVLFSNSVVKGFVGNQYRLNEFLFALFVQVLAIVINYIISKKAIFKPKKETIG